MRHTSNRAGIAEQEGIPLAIRRIENAALRNTVIGQEISSAKSGEQVLGTIHNFATALACRPGNREQIIFAIDFFHVRTFLLHIVIAGTSHLVHAHAAELAATASGFYAACVVVQLHIANLVATAVEHPDGSIVIEEQRRVVIEGQLHFAPRAGFDIGGFV